MSPKDTPPCSLNDAFSIRRAHANLVLPLPDVQLVRRRAGVTLNQAVLALVAGGLRRYLGAKGDLPERPLVAGVPMAFAATGPAREYGNHFINFVTGLATDVADPWERLHAVAEASATARRDGEKFSSHSSRALRRSCSASVARSRSIAGSRSNFSSSILI